MIDPLQHMEGSERAKDLEYLKDVIRNNCQIMMGAIKRIMECTITMTEAINAYEAKWNDPNRGDHQA